jgi:hypothetical protein
MMIAKTTKRERTLEMVTQERVIDRLRKATAMAATDFSRNRHALAKLIEDLTYELQAFSLIAPVAAPRRPAPRLRLRP